MPSRNARSEILGAAAAGLIVVCFCLILLCHDPLLFWNDDYELSILPVFADVARSWNEGHWPILSPYSWVCSNLAGEFQYGTFSIFVNAAVILIWKFPLGFAQQAAALSITHLFVLAAGAFLLGRQRAFSFPLSFMIALVAALNGWNICWGATDWFGALAAFAWLPWAWWGMERALERERGRWRFLWPASFVYLVVTGGFPYTVVMLGVLVTWLALRAIFEERTLASCLPMAFGVALGFGLSAPAWLALLDYVHGSGRSAQSALAHQQWVVPWKALPAFVLPCWTVNWADFSTRYVPHTATEMAGGLVPAVALLAGLVHGGRLFVRRIRWDLLLLGVLLLVSMLPSAGVFRWSFRWLPLIHLVMALCAAEALRSDLPAARGRSPGMIGLFLVGVAAILMLLFHLDGPYAFPFVWISLVVAGVWAASDYCLANFEGRAWLLPAIVFTVFLATYLCIPPNCGVPKYNLAQELTQPQPLDRERLYLSVYPAAEYTYRTADRAGAVGQVVRPGSTSMWAALRLINGYSPILAAGVAREFDFAIHGEIDRNVGDYLVRNQAGRAGILEELGVDGLVVAPEIGVDPPASDWDLVFGNAEGRVFHRHGRPFAPVRSVNWLETRPNEEFSGATLSDVHDSRNSLDCQIAVSGGQPALLVFSRPYFRGYEARLDARKLTVDSYRGLIPVVEVPAGTHGRLVLSYRPGWLIYGGGFSILCGLIVCLSLIAMLLTRAPPSRSVNAL